MQEGTVMELVKWFCGLFLIMMFISLTLFFFQFGNINSFKQQVNYQIERQGGLTESAVANINQYSNEMYNGAFEIESDQLYEKVSYGETVDYVVKAKFDIKIFPVPDVNLKFGGTGVSQVR